MFLLQDVETLYQQVSKPMGLTLIGDDKWNHLDFLFAVDVKKYFYNSLLEFLDNVTTKPGFVASSVKRALAERNQNSASRNTSPVESLSRMPNYIIDRITAG
jgi:hypothetical protein